MECIMDRVLNISFPLSMSMNVLAASLDAVSSAPAVSRYKSILSLMVWSSSAPCLCASSKALTALTGSLILAPGSLSESMPSESR